jgi:hypothetical protein
MYMTRTLLGATYNYTHYGAVGLKDINTSNKNKKKFDDMSDTVEGFCFVISVTGFSRPNTGENCHYSDDGTNI